MSGDTKENDQVAVSSVPSEGLSDRDDNYAIYKESHGLDYTTEEGKKVLRKIDFRLVPLLFVIYMLQYLDKNSINFASVYGLKKGTNLHGQDYSWLGMFSIMAQRAVLTFLGSIFYIGYLIAQWPAGFALQKLPMGKFLSITTISTSISTLH